MPCSARSGEEYSAPAELPTRRDTLTPTWNVSLGPVPFHEGTRLHIQLWDGDPEDPTGITNGNDDIASFALGPPQLRAALEAQGTVAIEAVRFSNEQVLMVNISVMPSR